MSDASWKSHFTQPISGFDPLEAQGLSELGFALRHRQIPEEEYLKWARENFELTSLDMKFFHSHPAPKEIFEKCKDAYPWGPECLPIGEWDDHLLVAGLEKPSDLPAELKPIFFLAPVSGLIEYWSKYQDEASEGSQDGEKEESGGMPEGLNIDATSLTSTQATGLSFSGVKLAGHDHAPEVKAKPTPVSSGNSPKPGAPSAQPTQLKIGEETSTAIKKAAAASMESSQVLSTPGVSTSSYSIPPQNPKVPPPLSANTAITTLTKTGTKTMPAETVIVHNPPSEVFENTVPEIKAQPQVIGNAATEAVQISEADAKQVFADCKKHYEKLLYITFNDQAKTALVRFWPQDFVATETPSAQTLNEDSFLAIVHKTQKPYHGYVVKNVVTDKFFKEVNSGNIPENITLVPLLKGETLVGAFLGWGPKSTYTLAVLRDMEKAVYDFTIRNGWITQEAA